MIAAESSSHTPPRRPRAPALACLAFALCGLLGLLGCQGDDGGNGDAGATLPLFPADYAANYVEVRDCRGSGDHDLNTIRILVDGAAQGPYEGRSEPFPVGAIVLKEEYDFSDLECAGPIVQWTVMQRLAAGSSPETLDWEWQRVDAERQVVDVNTPRCIGCHQGCGVAPEGYEGTCAVP